MLYRSESLIVVKRNPNMINFQHHNFSKYHDIRYVNFKGSFVFQITKDQNTLNKIIKRTLFLKKIC